MLTPLGSGTGVPLRPGSCASAPLLLVEEFGAADLLALENHPLNTLDLFDLFQRISIHQQKIGVVAFFDQTDAVAGADEASRVVSGRLEGNGGRYPGLHPQFEFALNGRAVEN